MYCDNDFCDNNFGMTEHIRPMTLENQLCFSLYSTSIAITRAYKPVLDELGLTYPQYLVLLVLWDEDGRTVGQIAERLSLESSTVTPLVKRLETAGLVARKRDEVDERRVFVHLTGKGRGIEADCGRLAATLIERSGMPLSKLADVNARVKQLREALAHS